MKLGLFQFISTMELNQIKLGVMNLILFHYSLLLICYVILCKSKLDEIESNEIKLIKGKLNRVPLRLI